MPKSTKTAGVIAGSIPGRKAGAARVAPAPAREPLDLTLRLRHGRSEPVDLQTLAADVAGGRRPALTRREWASRFGAAAADIDVVTRWARRAGVVVTGVDAARRAVHVTAPAGRLARLFRITRVRYRHGAHTWASHTGAIHVPRAIAAIVTGVTGFHLEPAASHAARAHAAAASPRAVSFTPQAIARHYGFPRRVNGRGQTIGVIALGGGFRPSDLSAFFTAAKLPRPRVTAVGVAGARNDASNPSGEVTGDIQLAGGLAPGARIAVYIAPNTEHGFVEAVSHAVHDRRRAPSVITISWGRNEMHWVRSTLRQFDEVLAEAAVLGVSVCCSSGDAGALADPLDRRPHVCFPGSSAYAIACGGTSLAPVRGGARRERPWANRRGASGGGVSALIARPPWQAGVVAPGTTGRARRLVPDVAANADPNSGYRVCFRGTWVTGAGTSAAAPLWAALIARINQIAAADGRRAGLITPRLYAGYRALVADGAIRPIASRPRQRPGWNRHTGLGVPHGSTLAAALARR